MTRNKTKQAALAAAALGGGGLAARSARLLWRRRDLNWSPPERFVRDAYLSVQTMGSGDEPVLLLHSLEGSSGYFGSAFDELADPGPLLVPDLLGFGRSPASPGGYSADEHVAALLAMLEEIGMSSELLVVGHGLGGLIGLRLASLHPSRVRALVMIGPPLYSDPASARRWLGRKASGRRLDRAVSRRLPGRHSRFGRASRLLARPLRPDLPGPVAQDRVDALAADAHQATLEECVLSAQGINWLRDNRCPVELVVPAHDGTLDVALLRQLARTQPNLTLSELMFGDSRLPLTNPDGCLAAIDRFRADIAGGHGDDGGSAHQEDSLQVS
jgi:pimeloyl-ACP methyl ester carboxylesterase